MKVTGAQSSITDDLIHSWDPYALPHQRFMLAYQASGN